MTIAVTNLFAHLPADLPEELFETLVNSPAVRIERIVSKGHRSPDGFWYDQPQSEWVLVLQGGATVEFEGDEPIELSSGDTLLIPAHRRHRVVRTAEHEHTIWLAVHFDGK